MNRKSIRNISLSSLAVSASAVALLGVSSVALSSSNEYCHYGSSCLIPSSHSPDGHDIIGTCSWEAEMACGCAGIAWIPEPEYVFYPHMDECWY